MSFRWFVYYGTLCGAWAGFVGWCLGRVTSPELPLLEAGVKGMFLGLLVAFALGIVDAWWNTPSGRFGQAFLRVATCLFIGPIGGFMGGIVGQLFYGFTRLSFFLVFGWAITGLLIGTSIGVFELLAALVLNQPLRGPIAKFLKGLAGGLVGGILGGSAALLLRGPLNGFFDKEVVHEVWSPTAIGFTLVGLFIGLMVGLTQVLFREAWVKVQSGFRAGRELLLAKDETVIGRAEGSDLGLFGDAGVDPRHARIVRRAGKFYLEDFGTKSGTFLNDTPVFEPAELKSGDLIRVGRSVLRFGERHKRAAQV